MTEQPEEPGNRRKALARFRPSLDTAERDAEAARMYYSERVTWQEVADRLGFANKGSAKHAAELGDGRGPCQAHTADDRRADR